MKSKGNFDVNVVQDSYGYKFDIKENENNAKKINLI